jgi:hypothetical protein
MCYEVISSKSRMREFPGAHPSMGHEEQLIGEAAEYSELAQLGFDDLLIEMGREARRLFLIFSGALDVIVDGQEVVRRVTGETSANSSGSHHISNGPPRWWRGTNRS